MHHANQSHERTSDGIQVDNIINFIQDIPHHSDTTRQQCGIFVVLTGWAQSVCVCVVGVKKSRKKNLIHVRRASCNLLQRGNVMNEYFFFYIFYVGRVFCVMDISRRKSNGRYQISLNKHFTTRQESRRTETYINKFFHVNINIMSEQI